MMKKKKVIFSVTNDLTYDQRMTRICSSLANAGYEVWLVGRELPGSVALQPQPFHQKRLRLFFHKGKLFYLEYNLRLLALLLAARFDAVCPVDLDTLVPCFLMGKWRRKPVVFDSHEYFTEVPELTGRPLTKRIWEMVAHAILPKLEHAYTVNESLAEVFQRRYGIPFQVIRNLPLSKPLPQVPVAHGSPFVLMYQGVLNEGRGLKEAIDCLAEIERVVLWIAGEGDLSQQLRTQVEEKKMTDRVVFWGKLQPDELHQLTGKAHLGINLLQDTSLSYYYSLANKTFDYLQAGTPAILMDFPEYRRIFKETKGFLLLAKLTCDHFNLTIQHYRDHPEDFKTLQCNARQAAKEWVWEKEEPKLLAIFSGLWQQGAEVKGR